MSTFKEDFKREMAEFKTGVAYNNALLANRFKRKPKYRNRAVGGYSSVKEARRAQELKLLERAGKIRNLQEQVPFVLIPSQRMNGTVERPCKYVADFVYYEGVGDGMHFDRVVEDVKSAATRTREYRIKKKLMLFVHGIAIRET